MPNELNNPILATLHMLNNKLAVRRPEKITELQHELELRERSTYAATGADVPHQLIYVVRYIMDLHKSDRAGMTIGELVRNSEANTDACTIAINLAETVWDNVESNHTPSIRGKLMALAAALVPTPYQTCSYSRLTPKATEYLLSLGRPDPTVVDMFFDHLLELAQHSVDQTAEEIVQFSMNNSNTIIYYGCYKDMYFMCLYSDHDASVNMYKIIQHGERNSCRKDDLTGSYYDDYDESLPFDDISFVANLWAARETRSFESTSEPQPCRKYIADAVKPLCSKPNFSLYQYVNITSQCERDFDEARRLVARTRKDVEYRKSIWLTRAYYAKRGKNKTIVLNKASVHHRKCTEVTGTPSITVYT